MPDHVGDRGAVRLDPGASRSPTYQPEARIASVGLLCIFVQSGLPVTVSAAGDVASLRVREEPS
jgi:hypothetical protein